jgi:hypothetical protein
MNTTFSWPQKNILCIYKKNMVFLTTPVFAEDSPHTTGDKGGVLLGVRKDTRGGNTSADNDYSTLTLDENGQLKVITDVHGFPLSAFGELTVAQKVPQCQHTFPTHYNPSVFELDTNGDGTCSVTDNILSVNTSTDATGHCRFKTRERIQYHAGQGIIIQFSAIFPDQGVANAKQYVGYGDDQNGVFFGYNGTTFSICRRSSGSDTTVAQSSWNGDHMDGGNDTNNKSGMNLDTSKGNVYFIQCQWHGMGNIYFYIMPSDQRVPVLVHTIEYANSATAVSFGPPSLPFMIEVIKTSGATDVNVQCASFGVFSEGVEKHGNKRHAKDNTDTSVLANTETAILTIRNKSGNIFGVSNSGVVFVNYISAASDGTKPCTYRIHKNANFSGTASYSNVNENNSIVEYDTSLTTYDAPETGSVGLTNTSTTVQLAAGASMSDDHYNGRIITITSGYGVDQARRIADYTGTNQSATVEGAWNATPSMGDNYVVENGEELFVFVTGKTGSYNMLLNTNDSIPLSPGETLSITCESTANTESTCVFGWVEKS